MSTAWTLPVGKDAATPMLAAVLEGLEDRTRLHRSIAPYAENTTRDYLIALAPKRHKTADRLGARPTGHLERAAESVTSSSDATQATVSVTSPGISRAFGILKIVPKNGSKYLTIPATAESYGRRARSFNDLRLAVFGGGRYLALVKAEQSNVATRQRSGFDTERAGSTDKKKGKVYYWLKKSVTLPQDRTLLPSDALLAASAEEGAVSYLEMIINVQEA